MRGCLRRTTVPASVLPEMNLSETAIPLFLCRAADCFWRLSQTLLSAARVRLRLPWTQALRIPGPPAFLDLAPGDAIDDHTQLVAGPPQQRNHPVALSKQVDDFTITVWNRAIQQILLQPFLVFV